jgi:hypothetical protein
MITVKVLNSETNQSIPAEVRRIDGNVLTVLIKDFQTSALESLELTKQDGDLWVGGVYSCNYTPDETTLEQIRVRVPKK